MNRVVARARRRSRKGGFTLVELLVVIVILSLLAVFVAPNFFSSIGEAEIGTTKSQIKAFQEAVKIFRIRHRRIPESWEELYEGVDGKEPVMPDLTETPMDPWRNEYELREHPEKRRECLIVSWGPDGEPDTEDDITSDNFRTYEPPAQDR